MLLTFCKHDTAHSKVGDYSLIVKSILEIECQKCSTHIKILTTYRGIKNPIGLHEAASEKYLLIN